jgi:hypothetical protein
VLTKTELREAKTKELERLQARIQAELEDRRQQEQQRRQDKQNPHEQLFYSGHAGTYRWEWVQCGHKERCRKCKSGEKHAPYLYRCFYKDGKQKSEYIKLSDVHKHPDVA